MFTNIDSRRSTRIFVTNFYKLPVENSSTLSTKGQDIALADLVQQCFGTDFNEEKNCMAV